MRVLVGVRSVSYENHQYIDNFKVKKNGSHIASDCVQKSCGSINTAGITRWKLQYLFNIESEQKERQRLLCSAHQTTRKRERKENHNKDTKRLLQFCSRT